MKSAQPKITGFPSCVQYFYINRYKLSRFFRAILEDWKLLQNYISLPSNKLILNTDFYINCFSIKKAITLCYGNYSSKVSPVLCKVKNNLIPFLTAYKILNSVQKHTAYPFPISTSHFKYSAVLLACKLTVSN